MDYPLVLRAAKFAVAAHGNQTRRYTGEPYTLHLFSVAQRVAVYTLDPHVIAAALLHDVVEDTDVSNETVKTLFGQRVAEMVFALTDTPTTPDMNRVARKEIDRERIHKASADVQLIKAMDMLDNMPSIVEHDPNFAVVFMREKELLTDVLDKLDPAVMMVLRSQLASAE
jgi:(p)ppGpp synthase/HD superfamily hydrolase